MKQVVLRQPKVLPEILSNQCSEKEYFGIESTGRDKGFISRDSFESGQFRPRCVKQLTTGNDWSFTDDNLKSLIDKLIASAFSVYQFETAAELFKWLAE